MNLRNVPSVPESDPLGLIWELLKKLGGGVMRGLNAGNGFKEPPAWQGPEMHPGIASNREYDDFLTKLAASAPQPSMHPQQRPSPFGIDTSAIEVPPPLKEDLLASRELR